jgi:hypothetical protein
MAPHRGLDHEFCGTPLREEAPPGRWISGRRTIEGPARRIVEVVRQSARRSEAEAFAFAAEHLLVAHPTSLFGRIQ